MTRYEELKAELAEIEAEEKRIATEKATADRYPNHAENKTLIEKFRSLKSTEDDVAAVDRDHQDPKRSHDVQIDERHAPMDTTQPPPLRLDASVGLKFVPPELRGRYARQMDGSFVLRYVWANETASLAAYREQVAAGTLKVYEEGMTPELRQQQAENGRARSQAILDAVNNRAAAAREAAKKAERERFERDMERREHAIWHNRTV